MQVWDGATKPVAFLLVLAAGVANAGAQEARSIEANWRLSNASQRMTFEAAFGADQPSPEWSQGYLVSRVAGDKAPGDVNVVVSGPDGQPSREGRIFVAGAGRVRLWDATLGVTGSILASGVALGESSQPVRFIAKADASGKVVAVLRTGSFAPTCICSTPDGMVWSVGVDPEKEDRRNDYAILRVYDFGRGQVHEALPRASFGTGTSPAAVVATTATGGPRASFLRCGGDSVGLYVNARNEYVELSTATFAERRYQVDLSSVGKSKVTALAIASSGAVFATLSESREPVGLTGLFSLARDRDKLTARWVGVEGATATVQRSGVLPDGVIGRLWGADGDSLVVQRSGENGAFSWHRPVALRAER